MFFFRICDFRQTRTNEIYLGQIFYLLFKLNDKICLYVQINQTRSQQLTTTKLIILMIHIFFASVVDYYFYFILHLNQNSFGDCFFVKSKNEIPVFAFVVGCWGNIPKVVIWN